MIESTHENDPILKSLRTAHTATLSCVYDDKALMARTRFLARQITEAIRSRIFILEHSESDNA